MNNKCGLQNIIAPFTSNARLMAILFNNFIDLTVHRTQQDDNGHCIIADMIVEGITPANIYGPNTDDPIVINNFSIILIILTMNLYGR